MERKTKRVPPRPTPKPVAADAPTEREVRSYLELATDLAWRAGRVALRYFQTGVAAEAKADLSPVTIADRESEQLLRAELARLHPTHGILGEEFGHERPESPYQWILDPIDGTRSFVRGVPLFGVLVGLVHRGKPIVGVANLPALDELAYAGRGLGCFWNGRRARVSETRDLAQAAVLLTDVRDFRGTAREGYLRLQAATAMERTWGDCYGHVLVATGRAEVMLDPVMKIWDCAALLPLVTEAGGTFTDWRGRATIDGGDAISTNGHLRTAVLEALGAPARA
ncbi:MAG: histidinol-phosphatase [Planctomycetes bacterium]|nr:histidinol-phosphatase [Planctomycetota bacterium]